MSPEAGAVRLEGLRLEGPSHGPLLRGLDLELRSGRPLLVVGGSGSGKTRLLKALAGTCAPSAGHVHRSSGLRTGMAFARGGLLVNQSLLQNLALPLRFQGMRKELALGRAEESLVLLRLSSVMDLRPHALSDRQRKLANLARIHAFEPELILLDEPMEGLDPRDHGLVLGLISSWSQNPGLMLVVATEHPEQHADPGWARLDLDAEEETP